MTEKDNYHDEKNSRLHGESLEAYTEPSKYF